MSFHFPTPKEWILFITNKKSLLLYDDENSAVELTNWSFRCFNESLKLHPLYEKDSKQGFLLVSQQRIPAYHLGIQEKERVCIHFC